jgi:NitT/TauT family transport system substrate-binding protein
VDPAKVQVINTDPANLIPSFLARKVDVTTALINYQPVQLEAQGHKVRSFLFADAGIDALSGGIAVHTSTIQEKPDMIRRFLTATLQGWNFALGDSATAVDSMMKLVPGQDRNVLLGQFSATVPLLQTSNSKGKPLGWMAQTDWAETVDSLLKVGSLPDRVALESLYTNEFLPQ